MSLPSIIRKPMSKLFATRAVKDLGAQPQRKNRLYLLAFTALGVVYGDIGTSPLYALRESFHPSHGLAVIPENVLGILSLIVWSLIFVISAKYLVFILRADNNGEGGILALTALATPVSAEKGRQQHILLLLGLFGTALLYGDGMITPAISVLSAVEGLEILTPVFSPYITIITIVILIGLFAFQSHGTEKVGRIFGPITLLWFIVLASLGIWQISHVPEVLTAIYPGHAVDFFSRNGWRGFLVLGSVFLVVTGGEALYSDLGHFGKRPIRTAWFLVVLPSLLLNYLGQGALLLRHPEHVDNPFYLMAPKWMLLPLVFIATLATVIASQALITGVFSITMQATQLGYMPRIAIQHTSSEAFGQIYVKGMNTALLISCVALVLGFRSSSNLAAAYGVAVTMTMVITTILFYVVARRKWGWSRLIAAPVCGFFLIIDSAFLIANFFKIPDGGWFPLAVGMAIFTLMSTWKKGRKVLNERLKEELMPLVNLIEDLKTNPPHRLPGTAVFMTSNPTGTPPSLVHLLRHMRILHERVLFLSVVTEEIPHVAPHARLAIEDLQEGMYRITLHYGFMEDPDIPFAICGLKLKDSVIEPKSISYILGRENLIPTNRPGMALWREKLFAAMTQNAKSAAAYFRIPPERVIEIGIQLDI